MKRIDLKILLTLLCYLFVFDSALGSDGGVAGDRGDSGEVSGPTSSGGDGDRTYHDFDFDDDYGGSTGGSGGRDDRDSRDDRDNSAVNYDNHGPLKPGAYRPQPTRPKLSDDPKKDTLEERLYRHWIAKNQSNFRERRRRTDLTAQEVTYFKDQYEKEKKEADDARVEARRKRDKARELLLLNGAGNLQANALRTTLKKLGDLKIGNKTVRQIFKENQGNCFSGDTKVLTEGKNSSLEYKEIKDITLEDKVWTCSYSDQTCKLRHPKKLGKRFTEDGEMVLLVLENDEGVSTEIEVTNEHPFNTGERSWTQVAHLKEGDTLWDIEGKQHKVVSKTPMDGVFEVYNLEIGSGDYDDDNYYVSEMGILSHNCSIIGGSLMAASLVALPSGQIALFGTLLGMGISVRGMAQAPDFETAAQEALVDVAVQAAGGLALKSVAQIAVMTPMQKLFEAMKNGMINPVIAKIQQIARSAHKISSKLSPGKIKTYLSNVEQVPRATLVKDMESIGLKVKGNDNTRPFLEFVDHKGRLRAKIHPPDKATKNHHLHIYDKDGNPMTSFLEVIAGKKGYKSPDAHIPIQEP